MAFHYRVVYLFSLLLLVPVLNACGGKSHAELLELTDRGISGFNIVASAPPGQSQDPSPTYTLEIGEQAGIIRAEIVLQAAQPVAEAFCELSYDASSYSPAAVEFTGELAGADQQLDSLISLDVLSRAGVVYLGQVITSAAQAGSFQGTARLARVEFRPEPFAARQASTPPEAATATGLDWDVENKVLSWGYHLPGDYNQDGLVSVHDLTPLGVHFQEAGPFDSHSALSVIDGNSDGLITVNDITPIGQHFNRSIEGYRIFATENAAEVPEREVSDVAMLEFLPLEAAVGDRITERLWFERAYPDLDPELKVWVVPVGDGEDGLASWPQQPGLAQWQTHNVTSFAGCPGGLANDLAIVGALPAVAYTDHYNDKLCYQRATLVDGSAWTAETVVAANLACSFVSLNVVEGHPAIAYTDLTAGQLKFVRAQNAQGTAWDTPVVIDDEAAMTSGTPLYYPELLVVNGYPAIGYLDYYAREIRYRAALDTAGTSWDTIIKVATFATPNTPLETGCSFALIGGLPAVAWSDSQGTAVRFARAANAAGSTWGGPVTVDGSANVGSNLSLFEVDGRPAVAYRAGLTLRYCLAGDAAGTSWDAPVLAVGDVGTGNFLNPSLCVNRGKPALAFYQEDPQTGNGFLGYTTALDALGSKWASPLAIDGSSASIDCGYCPNLLNSGMLPAVSYCNVTDGELWYAVSVDIFNQPPVAALTASVSQAKPGSPVEFSATTSADPDGEIVLYEWDWDSDNVYDEASGVNPVVAHAFAATGTFTPRVRVWDNAGGTDLASTTVAVVENQRPVADLVINPARGTAPFLVSFDASGSSDNDGTIVMYEWDWDGDGIFEHETGNSPYWSWTYEHEGELYPAVKVIDNDGGFDTKMVCCAGNIGPVAVAQATPSSGTAPFDVKLTCSGSYDSDGTITEVWWDVLDDGVSEYHGYNLNTWTTKLLWNGAVKIRLRVMDNEGAYGSMVVTVNVTGGWHITTIDSAGDVGMYNSVAVINGRPAVSYYDQTNRYLKFVRAADAKGYSWPTPMSLGVIADVSTPTCYGTSLAWINGSRPAIAFHGEKFSTWNDAYVLGNDANGTSWGSFVALPDGGNSCPSLAVIAGNPAIGSVNANTYFARASGATGASGTWPAESTIESSAPPYGCQLIQVNGNPALVYCHRVSSPYDEQVSYVRALDAVGDSWSTPVRLDTGNDSVDDITIAIINGQPAVAYVVSDKNDGWELRYIRANDNNGASWPAASKFIETDIRDSGSLTEISGRPAIAYVTCSGNVLKFVRASDSTGAAWPAPMVVDNTDENMGWGVSHCRMVELGGKPGISYVHEKNMDLKFAVWE
ncbi:PKD domain-containing protein [bacterium]|nr:PKD domain-containing protein [bacterium]